MPMMALGEPLGSGLDASGVPVGRADGLLVAGAFAGEQPMARITTNAARTLINRL
jgi:hypothetical protein